MAAHDTWLEVRDADDGVEVRAWTEDIHGDAVIEDTTTITEDDL